jgi:hypothetical protein
MAIVNVIVIHGIGDLRTDGQSYSAPLQHNIRHALGVRDPDALAFHEVDWSDIGNHDQLDLINNKLVLPPATLPGLRTIVESPREAVGEAIDSAFNASAHARRFLLTGVGDVLVYLTEAGGKQIRQRLIDTIFTVRNELRQQYPQRDQHYVTIVAHSLGSVIAYDVCALLGTVLRSEVEGLGLSHFFTLGSPLALFSLLRFGDEARRYAKRGVYLDRPDQSGRWLNFYDQQDPIAFLLRDVYPPLPNVPGRMYTIEDVRVQTGTLRAHTRYFDNRRIATMIARCLRADYNKDRAR